MSVVVQFCLNQSLAENENEINRFFQSPTEQNQTNVIMKWFKSNEKNNFNEKEKPISYSQKVLNKEIELEIYKK
ncbi:12883_t:CDS:2, partial [Funneliformis caledonium]